MYLNHSMRSTPDTSPEVMDVTVQGHLLGATESLSKPLTKFPIGLHLCNHRTEYASDRARINSRLASIRRQEAGLAKEFRSMGDAHERNQFSDHVRDLEFEKFDLQEDEQKRLIPWHGEQQLLGARSIFGSALFGVGQGKAEETDVITLTLSKESGDEISYHGPELRQDDGLVFMSLMHVAQDFFPGIPVSFDAAELCLAVFHRYDGGARAQLNESIGRLQKGFLTIGKCRVQLVGRFEYPSDDLWTVSLDKDIVRIFKDNQHVWIQRELRTKLPTGLATWLYSYVRAQSRLIITPVSLLMEKCGSKAKPKNFRDSLRIALNHLAEANIIDSGWHIKRGGRLHWMKGEAG